MDKHLYVIDETGIKENISIEFTAALDDIEGMNKDLENMISKLLRPDERFHLLLSAIKCKSKIPFAGRLFLHEKKKRLLLLFLQLSTTDMTRFV